ERAGADKPPGRYGGGTPRRGPRRTGRQERPAEGRQAAAQGRSARGKAINAGNGRHPLRRDASAGYKILKVSERREARRAREPRVEPDVDRTHNRRNIGLALGE